MPMEFEEACSPYLQCKICKNDIKPEKKEKMYLCSKCNHCNFCDAISDGHKLILQGIIKQHEERAIIRHGAEVKTILDKALTYWGVDIYIGQTGEEAAELIKELAELIQCLNHYKRQRNDSDQKLITEMAHVRLMLEIMQLIVLPGKGGAQLFQEVINKEVLRIRKKYETGNQNVDHN